MNVDVCLGIYGGAVAWCAPRLLRQPQVTERAPVLGVAAWLVAAVSVLGSWLLAAVSLANHPGLVARSLGASLVVVLAGRLLWVWGRTFYTNRNLRARHAQAARLLGRHDPSIGAFVVEAQEPLAFCMPHTGGGLVVVTTGAQSRLSRRQLNAVLAHEREHLDGRHHLLLAVGQILAQTIPFLSVFRRLGPEIARLLEMRADDVAARRYGTRAVTTAIAAMSTRVAPTPTMGAGGDTAARTARLILNESSAPRGHFHLALVTGLLAIGPFLVTLPPCPHPW